MPELTFKQKGRPFRAVGNPTGEWWCSVCDQPIVRNQEVVRVAKAFRDDGYWEVTTFVELAQLMHRICASSVLLGGDHA